jgi:hypothetical protein
MIKRQPQGNAKKGVANIGKFFGGLLLFFGFIILLNFGSQIINPPPPTPTIDPASIPREGHIVDLISANEIEVKSSGAGIDELTIEIRRLVEELLDVEISVGTYFLSHSGAVQNMIVRSPANVLLETDSWLEVEVEVACANMLREVPFSKDSFDIVRAPDQSELQILMEFLGGADELGWKYTQFDVVQAAIWIVTDDANFEDLGTLVSSYVVGGPQTRSIDEDETARAMFLVDEAGIDITNKAIWQDRNRVANGVLDTSLAEWIRGRE